MAVVPIVDGMIDLIKKNIIAKSNAISDITIGSTVVNIENSFFMEKDQEVILIDWDYNVEGTAHYDTYEYASIKEVNNTHSITLYTPVLNNWLVSNHAFVQKTIGHSPLYDEYVLYGDREVIPTDDMAVTVEPLSLSNEWIYIQGGLSEEYRLSIMVYGKDVETEEGTKIMNKYTDAIYDLLNGNIHIDVDNYDSPILVDVGAGSNVVYVEDTTENREYFIPSSTIPWPYYINTYEVQDNNHAEIDFQISSVSYSGGRIRIELNANLWWSYTTENYAVFIRHGRYMYDSRVDNIEYGTVQKGSAYIRAARLTWFGKEVKEHKFPQRSKGVSEFKEIENSSSSSSS